MVDAAMCTRNGDVAWDHFSSEHYWHENYEQLHPVDQEIISRVSLFFTRAFAGRRPAERAIDVGSGTNLYPALLMLPWTDQLLLTDHSASNAAWLRDHVAGDDGEWTWRPFWAELRKLPGYSLITDPREQLMQACLGGQGSVPGSAGIEQRSVFDLPRAQWQLGTMFFVAESITEDPAEFRAAVGCFVGALQPGAPFAAAFMEGSDGYPVAGTRFPALPVTPGDVQKCLAELGAADLSVERAETSEPVREGYEGMIVATGIAGGR